MVRRKRKEEGGDEDWERLEWVEDRNSSIVVSVEIVNVCWRWVRTVTDLATVKFSVTHRTQRSYMVGPELWATWLIPRYIHCNEKAQTPLSTVAQHIPILFIASHTFIYSDTICSQTINYNLLIKAKLSTHKSLLFYI